MYGFLARTELRHLRTVLRKARLKAAHPVNVCISMLIVRLFSAEMIFSCSMSPRRGYLFLRDSVQSRNSVHQILNRSPNKTYILHTPTKAASQDAVLLPKRTLSQTYSDVCELKISKDNPWVLKQHARLGKYWADILFVQGRVKVMKTRSSSQTPGWGNSSLNNSIHEVTRQLIDRFAEKGASHMSGHLSVKLMVDEEISRNSVCYTVYIAGCRQGTAVSGLLADPPPDLYTCYLGVLPPAANEVNGTSFQSFGKPMASPVPGDFLFNQLQKPPAWMAAIAGKTTRETERFKYYPATVVNLVSQQLDFFELWDRSRFSRIDPLPWWWHLHISRPLNDLILTLAGSTEAHAKGHF